MPMDQNADALLSYIKLQNKWMLIKAWGTTLLNRYVRFLILAQKLCVVATLRKEICTSTSIHVSWNSSASALHHCIPRFTVARLKETDTWKPKPVTPILNFKSSRKCLQMRTLATTYTFERVLCLCNLSMSALHTLHWVDVIQKIRQPSIHNYSNSPTLS